MAPTLLQQRRTHNNLLFQKLLNLRDGASPFTLVLDTLEQTGEPLVKEFARRAKISKSKIIFISYTILQSKVPFEIDVYISARAKKLSTLRTEILSHIPPPPAPSTTTTPAKYLLIISSLTPLCTLHPTHISTFLSSLLLSPNISLLATYHTSIPLPSPTNQNNNNNNVYNPTPLQTLLYLSTSILTISPLSHVLASKRARDRSLAEPVFGLAERKDGIIFSLNPRENHGSDDISNSGRGVVVNMEIRRRSGRGIIEDFVLLPPPPKSTTPSTKPTPLKPTSQLSTIILLDEHPLFAPAQPISTPSNPLDAEDEATFSLHLTEKQKRDREGIVLPYFDAQKDGGMMGVGEGGRILYEMGSEDREDFDDEEDEI